MGRDTDGSFTKAEAGGEEGGVEEEEEKEAKGK